MSNPFAIEVSERSGPVPVLQLRGRLEASGAQELLQQATTLREQGEKALVLDLSEVEFLASSGLGTLLLLTEEFRDCGGQLILADLPPAVREVVDLLNLDQFLRIEATVESGLQHAAT
jgi:stage II sporulation protein AA (anti-sigma F factor antagonist)